MSEQAPPSPESWESTQAICERFNICRSTLWLMSKKPDFPGPARFGRCLRWNAESIKVYLLQRGKRQNEHS